MKNDDFNEYIYFDDKIEISQRERQRPDRQPDNSPQGPPGRPPQGPPGRPPGRPGQPGFPGVLPPNFLQIFPSPLRICLYQYTYIWLNNGRDFWFYPISFTGNFLVGFRWREYGWEYEVLDIRLINYYYCS